MTKVWTPLQAGISGVHSHYTVSPIVFAMVCPMLIGMDTVAGRELGGLRTLYRRSDCVFAMVYPMLIGMDTVANT